MGLIKWYIERREKQREIDRQYTDLLIRIGNLDPTNERDQITLMNWESTLRSTRFSSNYY
ncbi:MAG: hypothetical protein JW754_03970 [Candidatus Aenigmarchaeota archaeon]|nr:hypothetical protein [Candidatus Aenigmarchaeota archaeon]